MTKDIAKILLYMIKITTVFIFNRFKQKKKYATNFYAIPTQNFIKSKYF